MLHHVPLQPSVTAPLLVVVSVVTSDVNSVQPVLVEAEVAGVPR